MGSKINYIESSMKIKFRALFDKINEPNYVMDNYYSDSLINKIIETRKDNSYICYISDLLVEPIQNLEKYHVSVQVFLVRMLAFCVSKELYWAKITNNINEPLRKVYSNIASPNMNPSLCVAYLEVARSLQEQHTGLYWLLDSGAWKEILSADKNFKTVFVTRQTYKFGSRLVWRLNCLEDEANLKQVLNFILRPLIEKEPMIIDTITIEQEEEVSKAFEPMIHMLVAIMSEYEHLTQPSLVVNSLLNHFKLTSHLFLIINRIRNDSFMSHIGKLIFRLVLAKVLHNKPLVEGTIHTAEDFNEISAVYFNTINNYLNRRKAMMILDYCYTCNEIWNRVWHNNKPNISTLDGKKVDLQNKMLFICLVPAISYITRHMPDGGMQREGRFQDYIMKLINASCEHTSKICRLLSEVTLELDTEDIVLQSVKRLSSLNNSMSIEQANLVFQGLFHVLKQFEPKEDGESTPEAMFQEDQENLLLYTYVLEAIYLIVKNYNINWHESLEVICLYNMVYNLLKKPNLSNKNGIVLYKRRPKAGALNTEKSSPGQREPVPTPGTTPGSAEARYTAWHWRVLNTIGRTNSSLSVALLPLNLLYRFYMKNLEYKSTRVTSKRNLLQFPSLA